jgi:hypothetical protein
LRAFFRGDSGTHGRPIFPIAGLGRWAGFSGITKAEDRVHSVLNSALQIKQPVVGSIE